jgi:hypothetical protein
LLICCYCASQRDKDETLDATQVRDGFAVMFVLLDVGQCLANAGQGLAADMGGLEPAGSLYDQSNYERPVTLETLNQAITRTMYCGQQRNICSNSNITTCNEDSYHSGMRRANVVCLCPLLEAISFTYMLPEFTQTLVTSGCFFWQISATKPILSKTAMAPGADRSQVDR